MSIRPGNVGGVEQVILPMSIRSGDIGGVEQVILPPVGGPGERDSIPLPARAAPVRCP